MTRAKEESERGVRIGKMMLGFQWDLKCPLKSITTNEGRSDILESRFRINVSFSNSNL